MEPSNEGSVRVERGVRRTAESCGCDHTVMHDCVCLECKTRFAIFVAVDAINTQLREHGVDMQFDPRAFIPEWCA